MGNLGVLAPFRIQASESFYKTTPNPGEADPVFEKRTMGSKGMDKNQHLERVLFLIKKKTKNKKHGEPTTPRGKLPLDKRETRKPFGPPVARSIRSLVRLQHGLREVGEAAAPGVGDEGLAQPPWEGPILSFESPILPCGS